MHNNVSTDTGYCPHTALISWESDIDVGRVPSLGLKTAAIAILCQVPHGLLKPKLTEAEVFPLAYFHSMPPYRLYSSFTPT